MSFIYKKLIGRTRIFNSLGDFMERDIRAPKTHLTNLVVVEVNLGYRSDQTASSFPLGSLK